MRIEVCKLFRKPLPAAVIGLAAIALTSTTFASDQPDSKRPGVRPGVDLLGPSMPGMSGMSGPGMESAGLEIMAHPTRRRSENLEDLPLNEVLAIALSSAPATKDIPKVEQLVARTLTLNPEVVAARAELQRAQADLNRVQLAIAQNVIELRGRWEVARRTVEHLEAKLKAAGDKTNAELTRAYINARAELAQIERQLPILADSVVPPQIYLYPSNNADLRLPMPMLRKPGEPSKHDGTALQPTGRKAEETKFAKQLSTPVTVEFSDTSLKDVIVYLEEIANVQFVIDREGLADEGIDYESQVNLKLKGVTLADVLQAIEDTNRVIKFLVRPYGILVTTEVNAKYYDRLKPAPGGMF